jgi:gamma-glutamyltranspeptidase/glutathione hydrolase
MGIRRDVLAVIVVGLVFGVSCGPAPVDLSPERWGAEEIERVNGFAESLYTDKPLARGQHGVVTSTTGTPAVRAGLEALKQGGTAADAVVTTALMNVCLAAGGWVSYAGMFDLVYYEAETGEVHNLNASWNTLLEEDDPMSIPATQFAGNAEWSPSGRTALVHGFMAELEAAHRRFGALPWAVLFEPAIYYADNGIPFTQIHQEYMNRRADTVLSRLPETKALFTKPDGSFYGQGDLFKQAALAGTLRKVAEQGASYMYSGPWADKLVAAVQADGGKMTMADLEGYEVIWQEPVRSSFNGYEVYGHGTPAYGGTNMVEALNVAEAAGIVDMGYYADAPEAFFWLSQITQLGGLSYAAMMPEIAEQLPEGLDLGLEARASKERAARLWELRSSGEFPGVVTPKKPDPKHSDAIVAIDRWGNVAAVVHTINTSAWGETGINVDGISIADAAAFQQPVIAAVGPGSRLPDPTQPALVLKDGKPVAAIGSIGSGLHQKTTTVLLNLLGYGKNIKQAIDAPSHHNPGFSPEASAVVFEGDFSDELLTAVGEMGLEVKVVPNTFADRGPRGWVIGATIDPETGERQAAASYIMNALAMGY